MFTRLYKVDFSDLVKTLDDLMSDFTVDEPKHCKSLMSEEDKTTITLEVPGVPHEDIKIRSKKEAIIIEGKNRHGDKFKKVYHVPDHELDSTSATIENGLLTVTVPKKTTAKARDIPVIKK